MLFPAGAVEKVNVEELYSFDKCAIGMEDWDGMNMDLTSESYAFKTSAISEASGRGLLVSASRSIDSPFRATMVVAMEHRNHTW